MSFSVYRGVTWTNVYGTVKYTYPSLPRGVRELRTRHLHGQSNGMFAVTQKEEKVKIHLYVAVHAR